MTDLIIYGASDYALEVAWTVEEHNKSMAEMNHHKWKLVGFLDDDEKKDALGDKTWLSKNNPKDYYFHVAIGNPKAKKEVVEYLDSFGVKYANIVHPSVIMPEIKLGNGCYIGAGNILTVGVELRDHVIINLGCTIGHKTSIGKYSCINPGCNISGGTTIEEGVYVGTNAVILQNRKIGKYSIIGASAMVNKDVLSYSKVMGVPARISIDK